MSQNQLSLASLFRFAVAVTAAASLHACSTAAPLQPELPTNLFVADTGHAGDSGPAANWWESFGDTQLDTLVVHALAANPDLAAAQAAARRAVAQSSAADAGILPSVELTANATRQRFTENGLVPPPYAGSWMNSGNVSARLAWNLDLFGADRARRAAVLSVARAAALDARYSRNAVSAAVVELYFDLGAAYVDRDLLLAQQKQSDSLRTIAAGRMGAGLDSATALHRLDAQRASQRVELAQAEERIAVTAGQLAALAGEGPQWPLVRQRPSLRPLPADWQLPVTLCADLLGRRADVEAARERVLAATHGVTAAGRDYFPNLSLGALAGLDSFALSSLFDGASRVFSVGPALSLPLFDAGRRRAVSAERRAEYDIAVADYRRSVLTAVRETSEASMRLQSWAAQQASAAAGLEAEDAAYRIALRRAQRGLGSDAEALEAQDRLLKQQRRAAQLAAQQRALIVDLYRALGGGAMISGERS